MRTAPLSQVPSGDDHTVRVNIGGVDPIAFRFIAGDDRAGQLIDVFYGGYAHTLCLSPSGKKAQVLTSKRTPVKSKEAQS